MGRDVLRVLPRRGVREAGAADEAEPLPRDDRGPALQRERGADPARPCKTNFPLFGESVRTLRRMLKAGTSAWA